MLTHVSATSIKLFKSCPRRWYERYVLEKKEPTSKAMLRGNEVHRQLEEYLLNGTLPDDSTEGQIAKAGLDHLPPPPYDIELSLEHLPIEDTPAPFKGFIDMYIAGDTPEILDHKTTSNFKYALSEDDLAEDTQLIIYAAHALHNCDAPVIRLTHVCYLTKAPYKSQRTSTLVSRAHVEELFQDILKTVQEMVTASELPANALEKNKDYCWSYGKRCPYFDDCQRTIKNKGVKHMSDKHLTVLDRLRGVETQEQEQATTTGFTLYVNCSPLGVEIKPLYEGLSKLVDKVCEVEKVKHISLVPYAKGYDLLSALIIEQGLPAGHYYISSRSPFYEKCGDALHTQAELVVISQ